MQQLEAINLVRSLLQQASSSLAESLRPDHSPETALQLAQGVQRLIREALDVIEQATL